MTTSWHVLWAFSSIISRGGHFLYPQLPSMFVYRWPCQATKPRLPILPSLPSLDHKPRQAFLTNQPSNCHTRPTRARKRQSDRDIKGEELNRKAREKLENGRRKAANRTYGEEPEKSRRKAGDKLTKPYRKITFQNDCQTKF